MSPFLKEKLKLRIPNTSRQILFYFYLLIFTSFSSPYLGADPWGKDADLASKPYARTEIKKISTPFFGKFGETAIAFHQEIISPCDGPRSHFLPSSSQYTLDAMRKYGFFKGFTMGCDRLMRENNEDWVYDRHISGLKLNHLR